jgi:hypothetical protein
VIRVGQRFGRLIVTALYSAAAGRHRMTRVVCDCGGVHHARASDVRRGNVRSCGCLRRVKPAATREKMRAAAFLREARRKAAQQEVQHAP